MITENEMQISNMSYTEKDFASIYPALLDLTKKLTNKWDPSISNESDPGNVLLKLLAAIGDKNSYNIDKNVLECFMPTATQETSMRMLTEAVGYNMRYYQSAMTDISFKYTADVVDPIKFGRFSTVVTNREDSVAYTLIEDATISYKNVAVSALAIEGQLNDLIVGGKEVVQLSNLDDNNRIYFPELYVAENGVFITNDGLLNFDDWVRVTNLNTQQPLTTCYKFGYDSLAELPYIEFPTDIAQIIGAGLRISYITTTAEAGNVSAGTLTEISSTNAENYAKSNLLVFNPSASVNGKSKETIDEAYNSFKKIIGTFDTLITTRDYANAIYNLQDEYRQPLVSNATVTDRVDDFNYGLNVVTYDAHGQYTEYVPNSNITVSDLILYPLKPYRGENYNVLDPSYIYNISYEPLKVRTANNTFTDDAVLVNDLDELRCIGHTFKDLPDYESAGEDLIYNFRNIATLDAQLFTYAKVNAIAQAEIKNNVLKALSDNFNARMVDYGYEIPYDRLVDVIHGADSRIKSVSLGEPVYRTEMTMVDGNVQELIGSEVTSELVAKNVLGGKLSLFLYDSRFEWRFGQADIESYDNVATITTALTIPVGSSSTFNYTMDANEAMQFISPSLSTTLIYPAGVYYNFTNNSNSNDTSVIIEANTNHILTSGEVLNLYYYDTTEQLFTKTYEAGTIIRPSFDVYYTTEENSITSVNNVNYNKVNTNQQLEIREYVKIRLENLNTPIYWVRNTRNNTLFEQMPSNENEQSIILDSGEYFIYSTSNFDDLVVLGAGTKISRGGSSVDRAAWTIDNTLSLENINLNGLDAFTQSDWQYKKLTANNYVDIQEMQVVTAGPSSVINITWGTDRPASLQYTWQECDASEITVTVDDKVTTLEQFDESFKWGIRTRLDLNAGPTEAQTLITNANKSQAIFLTLSGTENLVEIDGDATGKKSLMFNYPVTMAGGKNLDAKVTNVLLGTTSYSLSAMSYTAVDAKVEYEDGSNPKILDPSGNINLNINKDQTVILPVSVDKFQTEQPSQEELEQGVSLTFEYNPYGSYIVPVLFEKNGTTAVTVSSNCVDVYEYNDYDQGEKVAVTTLSAGLHNLELVAKWLGEYGTEADLNAARSNPAGNRNGDICRVVGYVLLNSQPSDWNINWASYYEKTTSDEYVRLGNEYRPDQRPTWASDTYYRLPTDPTALYKLYQWNSSNSTWSVMQEDGVAISSDQYKLVFEASIDPAQSSPSMLTIGKIHKILDLNMAISKTMNGDAVLDKIRELTNGITDSDGNPIRFYYTYVPNNYDVIETDDILSPEAFWDVNNVANKITIAQLDLINSRVYIARASQM